MMNARNAWQVWIYRSGCRSRYFTDMFSLRTTIFYQKKRARVLYYFLQMHKYLLFHHSVKEYSIIQLGPNSSFKLIKLQVTVYHWQRENYCRTFCAVSPAWHRNRDFSPCYRGERWPGHHRDKQRCSNLWCTTRPLIAFTAIQLRQQLVHDMTTDSIYCDLVATDV